MFAVFLFVIVFSFYCWLFIPTATVPKGWDCVESRNWSDDVCPLSDLLRKPLSFYTIRELKHFASDRHIKGYGDMTKAQLIEVLAA